MPGLIPRIHLAPAHDGVHIICDQCPDLEAVAPNRPTADQWARHHEQDHLLGLIPRN